MAYLALYREWRPQTFEKITGQDHVIRTLRNAVESGRIGHAYLFCGTRGTGKTTTAKVLAKAVNCTDRQGAEPCNRCANCVSINDGTSVDVIEVDAASNRGIDEVRELREKLRYAPATGRYRVYIVDEAHMLTNEAFNALLKTLEEPPRHVIFILATTEPHKVPVTILSRCQRFDFRRINPSDIVERLEEVAAVTGVTVGEDALRIIARAADGSLRDALSILDKVIAYGGGVDAGDIHRVLGTANADLLGRMAEHVAAGDAGAALLLLGEQAEEGKDLRLIARDLAAFLRALLLEKVSPGAAGGEMWDAPERMAALAGAFVTDHLSWTIEALAGVEQAMKWSALPGVLLELALVKACRPELARGGASLAARVALLEKQIEGLMQVGSRNEPVVPVALPPQPGCSGETGDGKSQTGIAPVSVTGPAVPEAPGGEKGVAPAFPKKSGGGKASTPGPVARRPAIPQAVAPEKRVDPAPPPGPSRSGEGSDPSAAAGSGDGPSLGKIGASWGQVIAVLRKERPSLYPGFSRAVPCKVNGPRLAVAFPEDDVLARERAGQKANKDYFEKLLGRVLGGVWEVSFTTFRGDPPSPGRPGPASKPVEEAGRIFGGEEITEEDDGWDSLF